MAPLVVGVALAPLVVVAPLVMGVTVAPLAVAPLVGVAVAPLVGVAVAPLVGVALAPLVVGVVTFGALPTKEVKPQLSISMAMTPS